MRFKGRCVSYITDDFKYEPKITIFYRGEGVFCDLRKRRLDIYTLDSDQQRYYP